MEMTLPPHETILIRHGRILSPDRPAGDGGTADIAVAEGRITEIGAVAPERLGEFARIIEADGKLVVPGLVNAHLHSPANLCSGTIDVASHPAFMWLNQADTAGRSRDEILVAALLGCAQMLMSGTTAVIDHFPEQNFGAADVAAIVDAYARSGMRAVVALRIWDREYGDIFPDAAALPPALLERMRRANPLAPKPREEIEALCEESMQRWHGAAEGRVGIFPGPSNPSRCSDELLAWCEEAAVRHGAGVHTHLLETTTQARIAEEKYGCTMVAHLDRLGVLTERLSCAHSNWVTEADIELMAAHGAVAVHNPESNLKFATGFMPIVAMKRLGLTVALGTDGASHNDNLVLHNAMQLAAILHRYGEKDRARWINSADAFAMATLGGAKAMRLGDEIGAVAVGRRADLAIYNPAAPWWTPLNDPVQHLVHAENGASVETVIVDGRIVVADRKLLAFDLDAVQREARGMLAAIRQRNADLGDFAAHMAALV
jgi:cytosine/adenosine deaminase-related metal-dependent hydrolase